jgi:hypothetical protein
MNAVVPLTFLAPAYRTAVKVGGQAVLVGDPVLNWGGGYIVNPATLRDQLIDGQTSSFSIERGQLNTYAYEQPVIPINGIQFVFGTETIPYAENLYVSLVGPPGLIETVDVTELQPGERFIVPPGTSVWVNATTSGHAFTAFFITRQADNYPPAPIPSTFPPLGPSGLTRAIPAYLYQEYSDDDDLQAFFAAYNQIQQNYVDTFNALNLPIYTGDIIYGPLLDWVAEGLYGIRRPWISSGKSAQIGPLNTMFFNQPLVIDGFEQSLIGPIALANDDVFKRVITWHYQKGDGKYCSVRWMKRRVMRFLIGKNGTSPPIDQTNQISIAFGDGGVVVVRFVNGLRTVVGGCIPNVFWPGAQEPIDNLDTVYQAYEPLPFTGIFSEALASGALEVPFQTNFAAVIG